MSRQPDLTYTDLGIFTMFWPETPAGESAWNAMAQHTENTGKVLTMQAPSVIAQLRAAGYVVHKAKPTPAPSVDTVAALDALLAELQADVDGVPS